MIKSHNNTNVNENNFHYYKLILNSNHEMIICGNYSA